MKHGRLRNAVLALASVAFVGGVACAGAAAYVEDRWPAETKGSEAGRG